MQQRDDIILEAWREKTELGTYPDGTYYDDLPVMSSLTVYREKLLPELYRLGAIRKKDLVVGQWYSGSCRNSSRGKWNGENFEYVRWKFGEPLDSVVPHFEDETGEWTDLFVPVKPLEVG